MDETKADIGLAEMLINGVALAGIVKNCGWFEGPAIEATGGTTKNVPSGTIMFDGIAHMGTSPCATGITCCCC